MKDGEKIREKKGARKTIKSGTGSGDVNSRFYVTAEKGFEKAGFQITTKDDWLSGYDSVSRLAHTAFVKDICRQAKEEYKMAVMLGMETVMSEP